MVIPKGARIPINWSGKPITISISSAYARNHGLGCGGMRISG
jgi:hypothetical protein